MNQEQEKVFLETKLRNLKRKYSRVIQHPDLTDTALELHREIENIENQLAMT